MRIIAGEFRSRRLKAFPAPATRPTPDRLRETLFDILQTQIGGATFLDAYAGTGAVGIEALSRGASHVWFLEKNRAALEVIRENLESLGLDATCDRRARAGGVDDREPCRAISCSWIRRMSRSASTPRCSSSWRRLRRG